MNEDTFISSDLEILKAIQGRRSTPSFEFQHIGNKFKSKHHPDKTAKKNFNILTLEQDKLDRILQLL